MPDRAPGPEARYQERETVELAFIAALQRLPPRQTAPLLLCDVVGFSVAETAAMLDTSPIGIKGVLERARAALARQRSVANNGDPPPPGSAQEQDLARRFASAFSADDIDGVVALLTDDASFVMPPAPHEYHGPAAIAAFLRAARGGAGRARSDSYRPEPTPSQRSGTTSRNSMGQRSRPRASWS